MQNDNVKIRCYLLVLVVWSCDFTLGNSNWSKFVVALISSLSKKLIAKRGLMQLANDISGRALTLYYAWVQLLHLCLLLSHKIGHEKMGSP